MPKRKVQKSVETVQPIKQIPARVGVRYGRWPAPEGGWKDEGGGYAYRNPGLDLSLGDIVMVPSTYVSSEPQHATVVSLQPTYTGPVATILQHVLTVTNSDGLPPWLYVIMQDNKWRGSYTCEGFYPTREAAHARVREIGRREGVRNFVLEESSGDREKYKVQFDMFVKKFRDGFAS